MQISLEYRFDLFGNVLLEVLSIGSFIFLWQVIYQGRDEINGLTLDEAIIYFLFIPVVGSYTRVELVNSLGAHIKDGFLSAQLLHPYKILLSYIFEDLGSKVYQMLLITMIYALLVVTLSLTNLVSFHFEISSFTLALIFVVLGLLLNYSINLVYSLLAFWLDSVSAFRHVQRFMSWILGGVGFPFEILSSQTKLIFNTLPFRFLYYLPIAYMLGNRNEVVYDLANWAFWFCLLSGLAYILWIKGIKRYGAYGN